MSMERKRQLALVMASILALGLLLFAGLHIARWYRGDTGPSTSTPTLRRIALKDAPTDVQEAVARLASSRVTYQMQRGGTTYLIISTGKSGERIELGDLYQPMGSGGPVEVAVRSAAGGDRLILAAMGSQVAAGRTVRFLLDGQPGRIPNLINPDDLGLVALPDMGGLVLTSPTPFARVEGNRLHIAGYARLSGGRFDVQVFAAGKGRVLGELKGVPAAAAAPDWGSFRAAVPLEIPAGVTSGLVLVHDPASGARVAVEVQFGSR